MSRVDFVIGNDRHHVAMVRPVLDELRGDVACRVLSLCELRGGRTPSNLGEGVQVERLSRPRPRHGGRLLGTPSGLRRRLLRELGWRLAVAPVWTRLLARRRPDLAVLPNDAAYPYDRMVRDLATRGIPFLLLQEGVRFPLPGVGADEAYGRGGAAAIAAWGPASRDYFLERGVAASTIAVTGSPRFDGVSRQAIEPAARRLRERLGGSPLLLLVTNPIDQQGFCSTATKMELVGRLLTRATRAITDGQLLVGVRIHAGEERASYAALTAALGDRRLRLLGDEPLHPLLAAADGVIVMASTVGLEALLLGCPLAVLETPGHGFVHDYVAREAAIGLSGEGDIEDELRRLARGEAAAAASVRAYLETHLGEPHLGKPDTAAVRVAARIRSLLG